MSNEFVFLFAVHRFGRWEYGVIKNIVPNIVLATIVTRIFDNDSGRDIGPRTRFKVTEPKSLNSDSMTHVRTNVWSRSRHEDIKS